MQGARKNVASVLFIFMLGLGLFLNGSGAPAVPSGTWAATGSMSEVRAGASAALLADGRFLVTGGEDASGALASAEIYSGGSFGAAAPMSAARSAHTSVTLQDGRVLVAGGKSTGGAVLASAALYNPATNSWSAVADPMDVPRAGHTASLLADGRVLIAGGETTGGAISQSIEIYNPATGLFTSAGNMTSPRKGHAAAVLADGRVLIAGGIHGGTSRTASTDIFNPETGSITAAPALITPRAGHSATTLLNGRVLVAGGNDGNTNGTGDLTLAETFDPAAGSFSSAGSLSAARNGHLAFLLPNNNSVLFVGGSASTSAELYVPNWTATGGSFASTGSLSDARLSASGSPLQADGRLLVAGGKSGADHLSSAELYGFATVKTDKDDYAPGQTVFITGTGWKPGETVTLLLHEIGPTTNLHPPRTAVADSAGNISNSQFIVEDDDIGVLFILTATGGTSNLQAQNKFIDKTNLGGISVTGAQMPAVVAPGTSATYNPVTVESNGSGTCTATLSVTGLPAGASFSFGTNPVTLTGSDVDTTMTINTTGATPAGVFTLTVQATAPTTSGGSGCNGSTESTTATLIVGSKVRVETLANGTGVVVPAQNVAIGSSITVFSIARSATDVFVANVPATWSLVNISGGVVAGDLVPSGNSQSAVFTGHVAGSANIRATVPSSGTTSTDSGTITVAAPDNTAPTTTKTVGTPKFGAGDFYVTGSTTFTLACSDTGTGATGCDDTFYTIIGSAASCPLNTNEAAYTLYSSPFTLPGPDGEYRLCFFSKDNAGNRETVQFQNHFRDTTAPTTTKSFSGPASGSNFYLGVGATITLLCADGAGASGCAGTFYKIIAFDAACPANTSEGDYTAYAGPFSLPAPDGEKRVCFWSKDNLVNREAVHTQNHFRDTTAPVLTKTIGTPQFVGVSATYVKSTTPINVTSADSPGSGPDTCTLKIDSGTANSYTAGTDFMLPTPDGNHTLEVKCKDKVGNEATHTQTDVVDDTAPTTTKAVGTPKFGANDFYVSGDTDFTLTCSDGTGSGCDDTFYAIVGPADACPANTNEADYTAYGGPFSLSGPDGEKKLCFFSKDNLVNRESVHFQNHFLDNTAPVITKSIPGSPKFINGDDTYLTSTTTIRVNVVEAGSGLASCLISIDGPGTNDTSFACTTGDNDFTLGAKLSSPPDGSYDISVTAEDNVGNDSDDPLTVILDNTAPTTTKAVGSPKFGTNDFYVSGDTDFTLTCSDGSGSGCDDTFYTVIPPADSCPVNTSDGDYLAYSAPFSLSGPDGEKKICFFSKDNLGNREAVQSQNHFLDNTAPVIVKSIPGSPQFMSGGNTYVTSATQLRANVVEAGSGLASCNISINGPGASDSIIACVTGDNNFTLSGPDGVYVITATATDNVANATGPDGAPLTVILDNTAPLSTITFPTSAFYDESLWNAGCTTAGLGDTCGTSSDGTGSGVQEVEVSLLQASSGKYWDGDSFDSVGEMFFSSTGTNAWNWPFAFANFTAAGSYTLHARATDNLGNLESPGPSVTFNVSVDSATIQIIAASHSVGTGTKPTTYKTYLPLALEVYDKGQFANMDPKNFMNIWETSGTNLLTTVPPKAALSGPTTITHGGGPAYLYTLVIPTGASASALGLSGAYLPIGKGCLQNASPYTPYAPPATCPASTHTAVYTGSPTDPIETDSTTQKYLQSGVNGAGKIFPAKTTSVPGSLLLIIEPEYLEFTTDTELLPVIYESVDGDWESVVIAEPPEGFVATPGAMTAEVITSDVEAVQFTVKDIGSDWTHTKVKHQIRHKGRLISIENRPAMINKQKPKGRR